MGAQVRLIPRLPRGHSQVRSNPVSQGSFGIGVRNRALFLVLVDCGDRLLIRLIGRAQFREAPPELQTLLVGRRVIKGGKRNQLQSLACRTDATSVSTIWKKALLRRVTFVDTSGFRALVSRSLVRTSLIFV